jgi:hypothetical protein
VKKTGTLIILFFVSVHIFIQIFYGSIGYVFASKKSVEEQEFKGIITKIYQDEWNHYEYYFKVKSTNEEFKMSAEDWTGLQKHSSIGDSIVKERGKLEIILRKQDGTSETFALRDDMLYVFPPYK